MGLRFGARHRASLVLAFVLFLVDLFFFRGDVLFVPLIAVVITVAWLPHWLDVFEENRRQKELESRFPEFVRNLTGAIKSGMPASAAVIHVSGTDYGALTPHVRKLANQIDWAIPFKKAFINFGKETRNPVIRRAIATVIQAEQAGGNIEDVLYSITESLIEIKKIKEERKSSIHSQVMQSYIIFFVFLGVMIIIQNLLIPYMSKFAAGGTDGLGGGQGVSQITEKVDIEFSSPNAFFTSMFAWFISLYGIFLMMSMIQGFFAGVVLGKLAEGDLTSGLKHSLIMMTLAFIVVTASQALASSAA
ncbi:type II secretion system F family protein [Candidatus Woesearchaeota archaeon]|nr:type II secretion system F family protein [Candidatus Woesearchaeota archaeon]